MKKLCTLVLGLALLAGCGGSSEEKEAKKVCKLDMGMEGVTMELTAKGKEEEVKSIVFDVDFDIKAMTGVSLSGLSDDQKDDFLDEMEDAMKESIASNFGADSDAVESEVEMDGDKVLLTLTIDGDKMEDGMEKMSMEEFGKMIEKDMSGSCE